VALSVDVDSLSAGSLATMPPWPTGCTTMLAALMPDVEMATGTKWTTPASP